MNGALAGRPLPPITLCVLLWARPGATQALVDYEHRVLAILGDHGGRVLERARTRGGEDEPAEIQLLSFASESALETFTADPRRTAIAAEHDAAIERTVIYRVELESGRTEKGALTGGPSDRE